MAVMAAFPLSLVAILSNGPFSINTDILGFFQNRSYTVLALSFRGTSDMSRIELSSIMSQDYLDFYYTSSAIPLLGSGLGPQCKNGPRPQILGPHNNPSKSCCPTQQSERRVLAMPSLYYSSFSSNLYQCWRPFIYLVNALGYETFVWVFTLGAPAVSMYEAHLLIDLHYEADQI